MRLLNHLEYLVCAGPLKCFNRTELRKDLCDTYTRISSNLLNICVEPLGSEDPHCCVPYVFHRRHTKLHCW